MLPLDTFKAVVASTPLVSIDLVVRNAEGNVLLGKRTNRPAQGFWFVPGGRIQKEETFEQAFSRLLKIELGLSRVAAQARFLGAYQHFYDDSFFSEQSSAPTVTTHYVALGYEVVLDRPLLELPIAQHSDYRWLSDSALLNDPQVHQYTKWYFQPKKQADAAFLASS